MNNKYGYRLVDILKRGRGRTNPLSSPRLSSPGRRGVESGARERDQSAPEMAGGDIFSLGLSVYLSVSRLTILFSNCFGEISRPRVDITASVAQQRDQSIATITERTNASRMSIDVL